MEDAPRLETSTYLQSQRNPLKTRRFPLPPLVVLLAAFLAGVVIGNVVLPARQLPARRGGPTAVDIPAPLRNASLPHALNVSLIREVWDLLHEKSLRPLDDEDLARGALRGIAEGIGDPYTGYADPTETSQLEEDLSGGFPGVGIEITMRRGLVTVIAPLRGSPAERAGIRAQDIIVKVDDTEVTRNLTLTEVVAKIRGPAGTDVRLTVAREGEDEPLEIAIKRAHIDIESVTLEMREGFALVILSAFNEDTDRRFRRVVRELFLRNAKGILLDLRNNPGGILDQAVEIAGHFLGRGALVVSEVPREKDQAVEHRTKGPADLKDLPVVILMNGGSASAAEILAAALNEQRGTPLVGEPTFGKGSVQELATLSDGSSLRITTAEWQTPQGKTIDEDGIKPTVPVKDSHPTDDPDEILDQGLKLLRDQISS